MNLNILFRGLKDPLYRNGTYLLLSSLSVAAIGFLFWMIASRFYSKTDVGIATAIISSANLIIQISRLGIDQSIVRYYPEGNKNGILGVSLLVTNAIAIAIALIFIAGIGIWSPDLAFLGNHIVEYTLTILLISSFYIVYMIFLAARKAEFGFIQNLFTGSRLIILLPLVSFGALGLFYSIGLSTLIGLILSIFLLVRIGVFPRGLDFRFIRDSFHFSIGNYIASTLMSMPVMLFPILVLNLLGAESAAEYYITFTIASLLFTISQSYSLSLFVEGSYDPMRQRQSKRSLRIIFILMIPCSLIMIVLGEFILGFFGSNYVSGYQLLIVLVISSYPYAIFSVILATCKVKKDMKSMVILSFIACFSLLLLGYLLTIILGPIGIGYAWIAAFAIGIIAYFIMRSCSMNSPPANQLPTQE